MKYDYLTAVASCAGCVPAERPAPGLHKRVRLKTDDADRANHLLYRRYKREADRLDDAHFVGRLAQYQYLNLDQAVAR